MNQQPLFQLITLPHREITPSKTQPRTHFAPEKMAELKLSLQAHGFTAALSHLLVRPLEYRSSPAKITNGMVFEVRAHETAPWVSVRSRFDLPKAASKDAPAWIWLLTEQDVAAALMDLPKYEIVCGERRWRGSGELIAEGKLATDLPAVIEEMSDARALKLQLIENLQREGLTPLEEAEGIVRLLELRDESDEPLYTRESLATELGCTPQHVGNQRKICRLRGTEIGDALEAGKLTATHARALASVPAGHVRDELLKRVLKGGALMPARALEAVIRDEVMRELRGADFDTSDPHLVPIEFEPGHNGEDDFRRLGGACGEIKKLRGEQPPEVCWTCPFVNVSTGKFAMCMNPECFRLKTAAAHQIWEEKVFDSGKATALTMEEAVKVFDYSGRKLAFNSGYVELEGEPDEKELKAGASRAGDKTLTWKNLIRGQGVPIVLAKDSARKIHEIVNRDLAKKAAHQNGHLIFRDSDSETRLDDEPSSTETPPAVDYKADTLAKKEATRQAQALRKAEMAAIVLGAEGKVRRRMLQLPKPFWGYAALSLASGLSATGDLEAILTRRAWKEEELATIVGDLSLGECFGFVVEGLVALADAPGVDSAELWANLLGVKLGAIRKQAAKAQEKKAA